jgi:two-component sensor histidine kinase
VRNAWIYEIIKKIPENTLTAYGFAIACIVIATLARIGFGFVGASVVFPTYYPAVLVAALVAGGRAGLLSIVLSLLVAWWAFTLPAFEFQHLSSVQALNFSLFIFSGLLIVWLASSFRQVVQDVAANEQKRELMVNELEHRGKNTFAVVEAIVRQSLQTQPESANEIVGRIRSVSSTNDLINNSITQSATLEVILRNELDPYGVERLRLSGPTVELRADSARNIALVVHEMVTNAVKYGALSVPGGVISVNTRSDGDMVTFVWQERGGPAAVAPDAYGFGSRLIVRTVKAMSGRVEPTFTDKGFSLQISFKNSN